MGILRGWVLASFFAAVVVTASAMALQGANYVVYEYDTLGRLKQASYRLSNGNIAFHRYGYDSAGNRTEYTVESGLDGGLALGALVSPDPVNEGGSLHFSVVAERVVAFDIVVPIIVEPVNNETVEGVDYVAPPQTVTLAAGTDSATFTIETLDDGLVDRGGGLRVSLGPFVDDEGHEVRPFSPPCLGILL